MAFCTTAVLWFTALTSFDEPDIGAESDYFTNIANDVFGDIICDTDTSNGIMDDTIIYQWSFNLGEAAMTTFLDITNDFAMAGRSLI